MEIEKKNKVGRPQKYSSDEERRKIAAQKFRDKYISRKRTTPNRADNPCYNLWSNAKKRAKERDIDFDIKLEDLVIPDVCPLLGIHLLKGSGTHTDNSPTLDKIIPQIGYVKGNIQIVSMRANRIKNDATFQEFEKIYEVWKSQRESL